MHEPASSRLVIGLTDNEGSFKPTRVIEFIDVQQFDSRWTDRKDGWVEGLIGAHEIAPADENADFTFPLLLAAAGTLSFVGAGLLARRLIKQMASK